MVLDDVKPAGGHAARFDASGLAPSIYIAVLRAGTALMMLFLSSEIELMRDGVARNGESLYPRGAQTGYFCVGG